MPSSPAPSPRPAPLTHLCTSAKPTYSYSRPSTSFLCIPLSHSPTLCSPLTPTLTGTVFMHTPTTSSIPSIPIPLPDTVSPYTTSSSPLYSPITIAHPPCTTVFNVTPARLASSSIPTLRRRLILTSCLPYSSPLSPSSS